MIGFRKASGRRLLVSGLCGALIAVIGLDHAMAQAAPTANAATDRPIRLLVGFAPGGSSDMVARLISVPLAKRLGQNVIVENRAGAGGNIAAEVVARGPADGTLLILLPSGHASNAAMKKDLPFKPVDDFAWISTVTTYPLTLSVRPDSPLKSLADFVTGSRNDPGRYTYTSVGVGTAMHLVGEWLMAESGGQATHVPFRGGTQPMVELLAGRVDVMIDTMTTTAPLFKVGRVHVLADTGAKGSQRLAGVPAVADTFANIVYESWLGLAAPAGTPPAVIDRLNQALREVVAEPEVNQRLIAWGGTPQADSPAAFRRRVENDIAQMTRIVESRKLSTQN